MIDLTHIIKRFSYLILTFIILLCLTVATGFSVLQHHRKMLIEYSAANISDVYSINEQLTDIHMSVQAYYDHGVIDEGQIIHDLSLLDTTLATIKIQERDDLSAVKAIEKLQYNIDRYQLIINQSLKLSYDDQQQKALFSDFHLHYGQLQRDAGYVTQLLYQDLMQRMSTFENTNYVIFVALGILMLLLIISAIFFLKHLKSYLRKRERLESWYTLSSTVLSNVAESVMITDAKNKIIFVNPAFSKITGYDRSDVLGQNPDILSAKRHTPEFHDKFWLEINNGGRWEGEVINAKKDGSSYHQWLSVVVLRDKKEKVANYVAVFSDITKRKEAEQILTRQAHYDLLTQLPNRRFLEERFQKAIARANRTKKKVAFLFLDIDDFKPVNDEFGHLAGDTVLKEVAKRLSNSIRETDCIGRLGGDEFAAILEDVHSKDDTINVAHKMLRALEQPFQIKNLSYKIGVSIGIAIYPDHTKAFRSLIMLADSAMYDAKKAGGHNYKITDPHPS
jgi:diguanylate cyclase (GGDEF)-like protein/PAS domain S-box-containing protein